MATSFWDRGGCIYGLLFLFSGAHFMDRHFSYLDLSTFNIPKIWMHFIYFFYDLFNFYSIMKRINLTILRKLGYVGLTFFKISLK